MQDKDNYDKQGFIPGQGDPKVKKLHPTTVVDHISHLIIEDSTLCEQASLHATEQIREAFKKPTWSPEPANDTVESMEELEQSPEYIVWWAMYNEYMMTIVTRAVSEWRTLPAHN